MNTRDNEAPVALKQLLQNRRIVVKLSPLHSHRINIAERDIHIFKNNFMTGLASADKKIPIDLWFWILKQSEITIHLLRTSGTRPRLSAYTKIFRTFHFNATPMAPLGKNYCT